MIIDKFIQIGFFMFDNHANHGGFSGSRDEAWRKGQVAVVRRGGVACDRGYFLIRIKVCLDFIRS